MKEREQAEPRRIPLVDALTDPAMLSRLSSDQIADLRFQAYEVANALATAYLQAQQRERLAEQNPEWSLKLMDVAQVSRSLGVTKAVVYGLLQSGALPFVQIGKYRRIRQGDVVKMLSRMVGRAEQLGHLPTRAKLVRQITRRP